MNKYKLQNTNYYYHKIKQILMPIYEKGFFHIINLIEKVKNRGGKVEVFPMSEKSYKDIGRWDEYRNYIQKSF